MITVNYLDGVDNIRCDEHLFQWDNGQKLCLSGLNTYVPNLETVDVHFCNKISKLAITVKPTVVSNNVVAPIPNSLLQDPYPIIAYFYVPSDNGSRTIVMVTIPIEPKKRPSDFILNEDEAIASLEAINNKVNTTLNNITVDYNDFKIRIEKELQDTVENLKLDDAKTLQSHPASDFVLKNEMPTSLPANGGNADSIGGITADQLITTSNIASQNVNSANSIGGKTLDYLYSVNSVSTDLDTALSNGCYCATPETLNSPMASWWLVRTDNYNNGQFIIQTAYVIGNITSTVTYIRNYANSTWSNWVNVADFGNASTVNGVKLMVGTREPQCEEPNALAYVPEGAWYGQY